ATAEPASPAETASAAEAAPAHAAHAALLLERLQGRREFLGVELAVLVGIELGQQLLGQLLWVLTTAEAATESTAAEAAKAALAETTLTEALATLAALGLGLLVVALLLFAVRRGEAHEEESRRQAQNHARTPDHLVLLLLQPHHTG